jgi:hypothetical protein
MPRVYIQQCEGQEQKMLLFSSGLAGKGLVSLSLVPGLIAQKEMNNVFGCHFAFEDPLIIGIGFGNALICIFAV